MDIITKTGEIWSENAIGAVISLIKKSDDSEEKKDKKPVQPEIIAIEGDGIILKNKKKGDVSEVHRL